MTELHNPNNSYNTPLDWFDRTLHTNTSTTSNTTATNNSNNTNTYTSPSFNTPGAGLNTMNMDTTDRFSTYYPTQLPPITSNILSNNQAMNSDHSIAFSSNSNSSTTSNTNNNSTNNNILDYNVVARRSISTNSHPYTSMNTSNASPSWIPPHVSNATTTNNAYSSKDSCDLSYDGDEFHHNHGQPTPSPSASTERSRSKKHRTPSTRDIHVEKNTEGKPPYSYATLIKYAIENSQRKKLTLSEIYQWVIEHYPYYGTAGTGWKNSIRHNLSLNKSFTRVPRPINEPGKGSYWQVDYRAAEAELRSKSTMVVRGRNNRSVSDPSGTPYHRPDHWGMNSINSYNNQRLNRDYRSLSLDSNMKSKSGYSSYSMANLGSVYNNHSYNNGNNNVVPYAYGRYQTHPHHHTISQPSHRFNGEYTRHPTGYLSSGYDVYNHSPSIDNAVSSNNHHYVTGHNKLHHQSQQASAQSASNIQNLGSLYEGGNHQPPYGQPTLYSGYSSYPSNQEHKPLMKSEPNLAGMTPMEGDHPQSYSTPQPHYKRVIHPTNEKYSSVLNHGTQENTHAHSPSPPQPTMDESKSARSMKDVSKSCNMNSNEYSWL